MRDINLSNENMTYNPTIQSHNYILNQCEVIEGMYDVEIIIKHDRGMEYELEIISNNYDLDVIKYSKNTPGKTKNYLKGFIDAHKLMKK